ncbi:MAG: hypothetical protein ACI82I_000635, partial [Gammaproteobacteria bacterium]
MSVAQDITARLNGHWHGRYGTACCPGHEDKNPSLSIADGAIGKTLLKCHAGCSFEHVSAALTRLGHGVGAFNVRYDPEIEAARKLEREEQLRKRTWQARRTWDSALPIYGTLGETYLAKRGITAPLPDTIRYLVDCWHVTGHRYPAMVAYVEGSELPAIHRTYLRSVPVGKAD